MATISPSPPVNQLDSSQGQAASPSTKGKSIDDSRTAPEASAVVASSSEGQQNGLRGSNTATDDKAGLVPTSDSQSASMPADAAAAAGHSSSHGDEKDKGSLSTTLAGTQKDTQTRTAGSSSPVANGPKSPTSTASRQKSSSTRSNSSLFSKIVRKLVPCIAPSSRAHAIEISDAGSVPKSSVTQDVKETEKPAQMEDAPSQASSSSAPVVTPAPLVIPRPITPDTEIVVPATPTKQLLPQEETEGVTSGAVQAPGSTGDVVTQEHARHTHESGDESEGTSYTEDDDLDDHLDDEDDEHRLIMNGGAGIPIGPDGQPRPLLPPLAPHHAGRKCLVLDLDETLVHSSFKSISQADYVVPVEIEYHWHNVYVIKRPGVDNFLKKMGEIYEIVVFTASLSKYADPVLDKLDIHQVVSHRLFRESCYNHKGNYVKDLSQLGRPIEDTIILDNSPASYIFHPNNAVPVSSWFNDPHDTELTDLCPFLADLAPVDDVQGILDGGL